MMKRLGALVVTMVVVISACSNSGASTSPGAASVAPASQEPAASGSASRRTYLRARSPRSSSGRTRSAPRRSPHLLAGRGRPRMGVTVKESSRSRLKTSPTKFKTASQAGNPPDVVVWAHDVIGELRPEQRDRPDRQGARHLRIRPDRDQGHDLRRPALRRAVFGREHRADPQYRSGRRTPQRPWKTCQVQGKKLGHRQERRPHIPSPLQVGQKGDPYHIYPVFTSGGGSFFGCDPRPANPDPKLVTVDSA